MKSFKVILAVTLGLCHVISAVTVLGIDLGTFTCGAYIKSGTRGEIKLLRDESSNFKIPFSIGLKNGKVLIGNSAAAYKIRSPTSVLSNLNDNIFKYPSGNLTIDFGPNRSLLSILSVFFRYIKRAAEINSSDSIHSAVISV